MARAPPRFVASFFGESVASRPIQSLVNLRQAQLCNSKHLLVVSRKLSGLADLLFNRRLFLKFLVIVLVGLWICGSIFVPRNREQEQSEWQHTYARLKPGKVSPPLPVPEHILKPPYVDSKFVPEVAHGTQIQNAEGITRMRASGQLAARVLEYAGTLVKPGVTTDEIDRAVHEMIIDAGAYPSPLGYGGFPKSVCTSVNECICHGIPDSRPLEDGDIINIDVTVYLNGYHGDTSKTFFCGMVSDEAKQLVKVTEECLHKAIAICGPGVEFKNIGRTINDYADKFHYGVVRDFVGHGVGKVFHSDPVILHFRNSQPGRMVVGQTFTIEPMLTLDGIDHKMWSDNWTVVTADGSLSAQFEHTLLIREDGVEILTRC